jgi:hypothetical protein
MVPGASWRPGGEVAAVCLADSRSQAPNAVTPRCGFTSEGAVAVCLAWPFVSFVPFCPIKTVSKAASGCIASPLSRDPALGRQAAVRRGPTLTQQMPIWPADAPQSRCLNGSTCYLETELKGGEARFEAKEANRNAPVMETKPCLDVSIHDTDMRLRLASHGYNASTPAVAMRCFRLRWKESRPSEARREPRTPGRIVTGKPAPRSSAVRLRHFAGRRRAHFSARREHCQRPNAVVYVDKQLIHDTNPNGDGNATAGDGYRQRDTGSPDGDRNRDITAQPGCCRRSRRRFARAGPPAGRPGCTGPASSSFGRSRFSAPHW